MSELKILVCGDVSGNFRLLFTKVDGINKKKGPFDYLFCVGNFFDSDGKELEDLKSGKIKVPLTTYILGPNDATHEKFYNSIDSVSNIAYLGKKGYLSTLTGLKIAYLSGLECLNHKSTVYSNEKVEESDGIYISEKDVNEMISKFKPDSVIDVLLTSQWPEGVTRNTDTTSTDKFTVSKLSSPLVAKLVEALKPRYHFCSLPGSHFEQIYYRNHPSTEQATIFTHFFALAPVYNTEKQRWLYAFKITPQVCSKEEATHRAIACPYENGKTSVNRTSCKTQFFFDNGSPTSSKKRSHNDNKHPSKKLDPKSCWFCISNAQVEKQLIISMGTYVYITLAKGVLVPEHALIVPINHVLSSAKLSSEASEEVEKYKKALANYFHDKNSDVIFFERNYASPHLQIQVVPVPKQKTSQIEDALLTEAKKYKLEICEIPKYSDVKQIVSPNDAYFYFEVVVNKVPETKYLHVIKQKFPLQFGREVLASPKVLNAVDRIDWRNCIDSEGGENDMARKMRNTFKPYDFTEL